jgi:hypothetical protein
MDSRIKYILKKAPTRPLDSRNYGSRLPRAIRVEIPNTFPDAAIRFPDADPTFPDADPTFPDADPTFPDAAIRFPDADPTFPDAAILPASGTCVGTRFSMIVDVIYL